MVRRFAQVSLAILLVLAMATMASAALNTANTSQKGSLLVFPKVQCNSATPGTCDNANTYFFIGNDNVDATYVKCYWMDNNQSVEDFHFIITANQPIVFAASENNYGPPFGDNRAGSLVCWAQDKWDWQAISFNHLYGYAMLTSDSAGVNVFYNAYAFAVRNTANYLIVPAGGGFGLNLEGTNAAGTAAAGYDACPKYLITNFVPAENDVTPSVVGGWPDLTLWPCKQDLRQDRTPTCTKAKFDIWNWNEVKFTGAYQCFKCFFEGFLHQIGDKGNIIAPIPFGKWVYNRGPGFGGEKFTSEVLGQDSSLGGLIPYTPARLRIQGIASNAVCIGTGTSKTRTQYDGIYCTTTVPTGLLGVLLYADPIVGFLRTQDGQAPGVEPFAGYTLYGAGIANAAAGAGGPGFILYDPAPNGVDEAGKR